METKLKSKALWQYTKIVIPDPIDDHAKFVVDGKEDEAIGIIMTYILQKIHFDTNQLDSPHQVCKKMNSLFDRDDENHVMQLEK
jgi:hypothetical protein